MGLNEDLVNQIQSGNAALMEKLWENNQGLIAYIAGRYQRKCDHLYDTKDLLQAGYLGLYSAAMHYSAERGAAFSTYAIFHLCNAMREVTGLRGKRDPILDAVSLDSPLGDDNKDTLYRLIPGCYEDPLAERQAIVREAVARMENYEAREAINAIYFNGMTVVDYANSADISRWAAHARLQKGYDILRKDRKIINLAVAEGYAICRHRSNDHITFRGKAESPVEAAVIHKDDMERQQKALHKHIGTLADIQLPGTMVTAD